MLGDLVEACRLIGLAAAPFMPSTAPRVLAQLGYTYSYAADGNGGPPIHDELRWGAHAGEPGRLTAPASLGLSSPGRGGRSVVSERAHPAR